MSHSVSLINHPCAVCFMSTSMWCSRCQNVWYCSPEHLQSVRRRIPRAACLGLTLLQDWPRHRLECVPSASARSNVLPTPPPVQPRLITVSAILFVPQEGMFGTSSCRTHILSRALRSTSGHYRNLHASKHACSGYLSDSFRPGIFRWGTTEQHSLDPRSEWGTVAIPVAVVVLSWRLGHECSDKSGN